MMERTLSRDVAKHSGQTVTIKGWLHKKRLLGGLNFISVRDRSGLTQTLIEDKEQLEKLRGMQIGTVVALTGTVVADERAPGVPNYTTCRSRYYRRLPTNHQSKLTNQLATSPKTLTHSLSIAC